MGRTARGVVERLAGWDVQLQAHAPYVAQHEAPTPGDFGIKLTLWLRQEHSGVRQLERSVVYSLPATVVA
jgi:hypothetical protein